MNKKIDISCSENATYDEDEDDYIYSENIIEEKLLIRNYINSHDCRREGADFWYHLRKRLYTNDNS